MLAEFRSRIHSSALTVAHRINQQHVVEFFMNLYRIVVVQIGLLFVAMSASAAVKNASIRITVLDSETRSITLDDSGVPKNCDGVNYDAYCLNSKTSAVTNILLVQEGNQPPYRVSCNIDTKWSRCMPLPKGSSFDARRDKHGLLVYYADDNGKVRKQLYTLIAQTEANVERTVATTAAPSTPALNPTLAADKQPAATSAATGQSLDSVKCSFSSSPAGAEVTVDGRYVGSTPSMLSLSVGNHSVEVSLPGFALWKRDLTVSARSELTINAVLQKVQ